MKLVERICFPTDFGKSSEATLNSVIDIAKRFGSQVNLVHVLPKSKNSDKVQSVLTEEMAKYAERLKEEGIRCTSDFLRGDHIDELIPYAERKRANLIVMGVGNVGKEKFKLGSNAENIIRNSSVPVWVIEKETAGNPNSILCPVDFSEESLLALDGAIHLCRSFDASLNILHVVKGLDSEYREYAELGLDAGNEDAETLRAVEQQFDQFLKDVDLSGINWNKETKLGDPLQVILDDIKANNIDLVMMGSAGKGALKRFLLGSVAERIAREALCSFIINKSEGMIHLTVDKELTDIEAIYQQGADLAKQGYVEEAIVQWKRCIAINELFFKAWSALVKAYEHLGDTEQAESYQASRERIQRALWDQQVEADLKGKHYLFS